MQRERDSLEATQRREEAEPAEAARRDDAASTLQAGLRGRVDRRGVGRALGLQEELAPAFTEATLLPHEPTPPSTLHLRLTPRTA